MDRLIEAITLGITQGLAEFFPVSSTGHLVLIRKVFGFVDQGGFVDAALHLATFLAILVFFWDDIRKIYLAWVAENEADFDTALYRRISWWLAFATIPAALIGFLGRDFFAFNFRTVLFVGGAMAITGAIFWFVSSMSTDREISDMDWTDALGIGFAQALAILPGVSRSGVTISTGLYSNIKAEDAARFSFLAGLPLFAGAGTLALWETIFSPNYQVDLLFLAVSFATAFVTAMLALSLFMRLVDTYKLKPFAFYLVVVGVGFIALNAFGIL